MTTFTTGKVEINVPDCPYVTPNVAGIPSWVVGWSMPIAVVLIIALFVLVYALADIRKERANERRQAQIAMAREHKTCTTCGDRYEPQVSK